MDGDLARASGMNLVVPCGPLRSSAWMGMAYRVGSNWTAAASRVGWIKNSLSHLADLWFVADCFLLGRRRRLVLSVLCQGVT